MCPDVHRSNARTGVLLLNRQAEAKGLTSAPRDMVHRTDSLEAALEGDPQANDIGKKGSTQLAQHASPWGAGQDGAEPLGRSSH